MSVNAVKSGPIEFKAFSQSSHSLVSQAQFLKFRNPPWPVELFVIRSEDAEVVYITRGYVDTDPEVYKNPLQEHEVRGYIDRLK